MDAGDAFPDVIDKAVREAGVVLGCWSPLALSRAWVKTENLIALERQTLIPIEIDTVTSVDVPAAFFALHRVSLVDWSGEPGHEGWLAAVRAISRKLKRPEILDRAKARAAVAGAITTHHEIDPVRMDDLWNDWARLSHSSNREELTRLAERGSGTVVGSLAALRVEDLTRPAKDRVLGGSASIGLMPPRGWARVRRLLPAVVMATAILLAAGAIVYFFGTPSSTPTLEQEVGPYLASLDPEKLRPFFKRNPFARDGMLAGRKYLAAAEINTPLRLAHFLAQMSHESVGFTVLDEKIPEADANRRYADRMGNGNENSGDGYRYRGRGIVQITGRDLYQSIGNQLGVDLIGNPDLASDPAVAIGVAALFWKQKKINPHADSNDIVGVTRRIFGGLSGLENRKNELSRACEALGCPASPSQGP